MAAAAAAVGKKKYAARHIPVSALSRSPLIAHIVSVCFDKGGLRACAARLSTAFLVSPPCFYSFGKPLKCVLLRRLSLTQGGAPLD